MSVILQPCASKFAQVNFAKTIDLSVEFSAHAHALQPIAAQLNNLFPNGQARIWGITAGENNRKVALFNRAAAGDSVLFYKSKRIFATGVMALKFQSKSMADVLWGKDENGDSFEYLYFLDDVKKVSIDIAEFNSVAGYSPNYVIQGFNVLEGKIAARIQNHFVLESPKVPIEVSPEQFNAALLALENAKSVDATYEVSARLEQGFLRQYLFPKAIGQCAVCGNEFPIDLLVAAHIKPRSACTLAEKKDVANIAMAMCRFGCDELYERGYISCDETGNVVLTSESLSTPYLAQYMSALKGKKCSSFSSQNAGYFAWHRQVRFKGLKQ